MVTDKFKYRINYQISLLPRSITIMQLVKVVEQKGISQDTFYRDRKIAKGSKQSIPGDRLMIYAKLFDCTLDDLLTTEVKGKSIRQQLAGPKVRKIKNGLS